MKAGLSESQKARVAQGFRKIADAWEPRFNRAALQQFGRDKERFTDALRIGKQAVDWDNILMNWQQIYQEAGDEWRSAFVPLMRGVVEEQCAQYAIAFGFEWDIRLLFAETWFDEYVMKFANEVIGETERELAELLQQAQREGWSIPTVEEHLEQVFRQWMVGDLSPEAFDWIEQRMPVFRRGMIARTEIIRSSGRGINELFRQWGVTYKEWYTAADERRCEWCAAMHGKIIPVGNAFWEQGNRMSVQIGDRMREMVFSYESVTSPPLHPNCRCCLLPWKEEWAKL
jgi:hypothetical protein